MRAVARAAHCSASSKWWRSISVSARNAASRVPTNQRSHAGVASTSAYRSRPTSSRRRRQRWTGCSPLTQYRFGRTNPWIVWFADAVSGASRAQQQLVGGAGRIRAGWEQKLSDYGKVRHLRSDAGAWRVLDLLPCHLVLTAGASRVPAQNRRR